VRRHFFMLTIEGLRKKDQSEGKKLRRAIGWSGLQKKKGIGRTLTLKALLFEEEIKKQKIGGQKSRHEHGEWTERKAGEVWNIPNERECKLSCPAALATK